MTNELKEKVKKYLTGLTSPQIQERMSQNLFPFFGFHKAVCLDLAWEVLAERELN